MKSKLLYDEFKNIGCCDLCALRLSGETDISKFLNFKGSVHQNELCQNQQIHPNGVNSLYTDEYQAVPPKVQRINYCVACLGLFQTPLIEDVTQKVVKCIKNGEYDSPTLYMAITVPVAMQVRSHALWIHLTSKFPDIWQSVFPLGCVTVSVKDICKALLVPHLQVETSKTFTPKSDLLLTIQFLYDDDTEECSFFSGVVGKKKSKRQVSRKVVSDTLSKIKDEEFKAKTPCPPTVPNTSLTLSSLTLTHASVYVAGRYMKLSRTLPQTPWIIGGERKMEGSVQEFISLPIVNFFKAESNKFGSSGREDVDVRMLGKGRPFSVELINPKRTSSSFQELRVLQSLINDNAKGLVSVSHLQIIPKSALIDLKEGEESKTKEYEAVCLGERDCLERFSEVNNVAPLVVEQITPIRVLHRRPVATRHRTIHSLKLTPLNITKYGMECFKVNIRTQAGTYVKEFVHGDFGRTKPSLRTLLKSDSVDILSLDVVDIELDWPPPIL